MSSAKQIVEAVIGPEGIGDFVAGALKPDFLLARMKLDNTGFVYPAVHDAETGAILAYMKSSYEGDDLIWSVALGDTVKLWGGGYDGWRWWKFSSMEIDVIDHTKFSSWRQAMVFFLKFPQAEEAISAMMKIKECKASHIAALEYEDRLKPIAQSMTKRGFLTENLDRRAGKGTACYIIGQSEETDASKVIEALVSSAAENGLIAKNTQAALRNERSWQIDFSLVNLFESDVDDFVTTAFLKEVPGHAETLRVAAYRDALRANGLPVYKIAVEPQWGSEITYTAYFDNRTLNLSRTATSQIVDKALAAIGHTDRLNRLMNAWGHGAARHIGIRLKAIKPESFRHYTVENEEDYSEYGEIAACMAGTIGDEVRLKRLVRYLKKLGFRVKEASLQQHVVHAGAITQYLTVEYTLKYVWHPSLALDDNLARAQVQSEVTHFLNVDRDLCGGKVTPMSNVRVSGRGMGAGLFTVTAMTDSLRRETIHPQVVADMDHVNLQLEGVMGDDDMEGFADVARQGLKTKIWLQAMRKELEARKMDVTGLLAFHREPGAMMKVVVHIRRAEKDAFGPEYHKHTPEEVMKAYCEAVEATGSRFIGTENWHKTRVRSDTDDMATCNVYTVMSVVVAPEPDLTWDVPVTESEISVDDLDVGEHERLNSIAVHAELVNRNTANHDDAVVLGANAHQAPLSLGFPPGTVYACMRFLCKHASDAIYAFNFGIKNSGSERVFGYANTPTFGIKREWQPSVGRTVIDLYAYLKPVGNLDRAISVVGPSADKWPQYSMQHTDLSDPDKIVEVFDPEDEVWVRQVVDKTPGYKDLERLKSAMRSFEEVGLHPTGATQTKCDSPYAIDDPTLCDIVVALQMAPDETQMTQIYRTMPKLRLALEAHWEIHELRHEYDTTDGQHSVWLFRWRSHDAPADIVPLHLRYGSWNEYVSSGLADREDEVFLVEQYDQPGEEDNEYYRVFAGGQDIADPLWRERLRIQAVANDIKERGYTGSVMLSFNPATLHLRLSHTDPQMMDSYFTKDVLHSLNNKHHFTNPGQVWAVAHDLQRSYQNEQGQAESRCNMPYMFINNEKKKVNPKQEWLLVKIGEAIEFSPTDMAGFGRVAAKPERTQVVQKAWQAFLQCFRDNFPGVPAYADFTQGRRSGNSSSFEFLVRFDDHDIFHILQASYPEQEKLQAMFREAVLAAGLKRYYPRRTLYYKWPVTQILLDGTMHVMVICKFSLKGITVPDKTEHVPNVHQVDEAIEWSPSDIAGIANKATRNDWMLSNIHDGFRHMVDALKAALPGSDLSASISERTDIPEKGRVIEFGATLSVPEGFFLPNSWPGQANLAHNIRQKEMLSDLVRKAIHKSRLAQHMPKVYAWTAWPNIHVVSGVRSGNVMVNVSFAITGFRGNRIDVSLSEALDINPEEFGNEVIRQTDPFIDLATRCQAAVRDIKSEGQAWLKAGTLRISPSILASNNPSQRNTVLLYVHILVKARASRSESFVSKMVKKALVGHGVTIHRSRVLWNNNKSGLLILITANAHPYYLDKKHPVVTIDFDTVSVAVTEGIDPEEFMAGADKGSKYGLYRSLAGIAASLAKEGWIGFLRANAWQGSGTWHNLVIFMAKREGGMVSPRDHQQEVEANLNAAFQGCHIPYEPPDLKFMSNRRIPGYFANDYPGLWFWYVNVIIDLGGRLPGDAHNVHTLCDIPSGTITSVSQQAIRGVVGPGQPA